MAYLLLIQETRGARAARSADEAHRLYDDMMAFAAGLQADGILRAAESLRTDDHAVRISAAAGKPQLLDGPFTEAREMVGGFFLLDVSTREDAIAIALRCPAVAWATVEVRECAPCHVL
ncbi:YciI family protein [Zoogloea sp.]|uniref:YciI family protein n=1 Tax=Zoogloea sp. TaxID=49181 RepID=UPI0035B473E0